MAVLAVQAIITQVVMPGYLMEVFFRSGPVDLFDVIGHVLSTWLIFTGW